jgi:hypothetical protein
MQVQHPILPACDYVDLRRATSHEDIRAALKFVGELAEQESFHPLPAA